jgi:hypothetical protein
LARSCNAVTLPERPTGLVARSLRQLPPASSSTTLLPGRDQPDAVAAHERRNTRQRMGPGRIRLHVPSCHTLFVDRASASARSTRTDGVYRFETIDVQGFAREFLAACSERPAATHFSCAKCSGLEGDRSRLARFCARFGHDQGEIRRGSLRRYCRQLVFSWWFMLVSGVAGFVESTLFLLLALSLDIQVKEQPGSPRRARRTKRTTSRADSCQP